MVKVSSAYKYKVFLLFYLLSASFSSPSILSQQGEGNLSIVAYLFTMSVDLDSDTVVLLYLNNNPLITRRAGL